MPKPNTRTRTRSRIKFLPSASPSPSSSHSDASPRKTTSTTQHQPPKRDPSALISPPAQPLPTPSLSSPTIAYNYAIARGEMGVLTYEPYKSLILPFWAFRTIPIAQSSATALWSIFISFVERGDFVGADMTRKFIQMGMTRARRYANWKGGRKYKEPGGGEKVERWSGEGLDGEEGRKRREKEGASELFKGYWRRCIEHEGYQELKVKWMKEKKEWEKKGGGVKKEEEEEGNGVKEVQTFQSGKEEVKRKPNIKKEESDEDDTT